MCQLCKIVGKSEITPRPGLKLEDWIDFELDDNRQPIRDRIRKNISYHLGNAEQTFKLSEAASKLFKRDYEGKGQIFVPETFLTKSPKMIFTEKSILEEKLQNPILSEKEAGKWRAHERTVSGESLEKNLYHGLKEYFYNHKDQEVLVLHGNEIMELDTLERID